MPSKTQNQTVTTKTSGHETHRKDVELPAMSAMPQLNRPNVKSLPRRLSMSDSGRMDRVHGQQTRILGQSVLKPDYFAPESHPRQDLVEKSHNLPGKAVGTLKGINQVNGLLGDMFSVGQPFSILNLARSTKAILHSGGTKPMGPEALGIQGAATVTQAVNVLEDFVLVATVLGFLSHTGESVLGAKTDKMEMQHQDFLQEDLLPFLQGVARLETREAVLAGKDEAKERLSFDMDPVKLADEAGLPRDQLQEFASLMNYAKRVQQSGMKETEADAETVDLLKQAKAHLLANAQVSEGRAKVIARLDALASIFSSAGQAVENMPLPDLGSPESRARIKNYIQEELLPAVKDRPAIANQARGYLDLIEKLEDHSASEVEEWYRHSVQNKLSELTVTQLADGMESMRGDLADQEIEHKLMLAKSNLVEKTISEHGGFMGRFLPETPRQMLDTAFAIGGATVDTTYSHLSKLIPALGKAGASGAATFAGIGFYGAKGVYDGYKGVSSHLQMKHAGDLAGSSGVRALELQQAKLDNFAKVPETVWQGLGLEDAYSNTEEEQDPARKARLIRNELLPTLRRALTASNDNGNKDLFLHRKLLNELSERGLELGRHRVHQAVARQEGLLAKRRRQNHVGNAALDVATTGLFVSGLSGGYAAPVGLTMLVGGSLVGGSMKAHHHLRGNIIATDGKVLALRGTANDDPFRMPKLAAQLVDAQIDYDELSEKPFYKGAFYGYRNKQTLQEAPSKSVDSLDITKDNFRSKEARNMLLFSFFAQHEAEDSINFLQKLFKLPPEKVEAIRDELEVIDRARDHFLEKDGRIWGNEAYERTLMAAVAYVSDQLAKQGQ